MVERAVRRRQTTSGGAAGSTRSRTAPLEVDRSSSQSALSERPGRWNGRPVHVREQTAPLEVGRSSSQSALSERPGRWNGRERLGERGGVGSEARLQPRGLPAHSRRVEGRTTVSARRTSVTSRPPLETRGQCTWGRAPACTVPHASRGLWLERDRKRVPQAGARLPREEQERGTFLVSRHAGACTAVQKLSQPLEWLDKRGGGRS